MDCDLKMKLNGLSLESIIHVHAVIKFSLALKVKVKYAHHFYPTYRTK